MIPGKIEPENLNLPPQEMELFIPLIHFYMAGMNTNKGKKNQKMK